MPEIVDAKVGHFCWVELQTKDVAAAKRFYGELLGWSFEDMPMPAGTYTMAKVGGSQVAGLMTMPAQVAQMGAPPSWGAYVKVRDVAESTAAVARLGGKVLMPATPMGPGTFSVIQDPSGAVIMLWNTTQSMGTFLYGEPGALTWNELVTTNVEAAQRFYSQLFGWKAQSTPMPNLAYTVFKDGDEMLAGMMEQPPEAKGQPSMWASYFAVADADATFAKATRMGAQVLVPLMDIPDVGRFGWLQDPQGAVFAILKNAT
jgi:predicted enzyme related to lactoylglutathione lyase